MQLTKRGPDVELAECDRLADEIEVTPEMIEAGVSCLYDLPELLGPSEEQLKAALKAAFCAMIEASHGK
jgi:hypothetical protein